VLNRSADRSNIPSPGSDYSEGICRPPGEIADPLRRNHPKSLRACQLRRLKSGRSEAGNYPGGLDDRVTQPSISIVIPTRDEAANIRGILYRIHSALKGIPSEIIAVDDSDHDNTWEVLLQLRDELGEQLAVVHREKGTVPERTLGSAVVTGIREAHAEFVCVLDADGQHPPESIPTMLALARETGASYIGASRYVRGGSAEGLEGVARKLVSRGLALTTRLAFLFTPIRNMTDPLSGFFVFRREIVEGVELEPIGWKISLEVLVRSRTQQPIEVPYVFARREDGRSKATFRDGLMVLRHILVLLRSAMIDAPRVTETAAPYHHAKAD
jgi:dolichol-phosphate mannosyltransferase